MENYEKELGVIETSNEKIKVIKTLYADETLAVVGKYFDEEFKYWGPWGAFSVNLSGYGMYPPENCIFINHDIYKTESFEAFYEKFCDKEFGQTPVHFGYATSVMVKLNK